MADSNSAEWISALKKGLNTEEDFETFINGFSKCSTNQQRVQHLYNHPVVENIVKVDIKKRQKNVEESISLRDQGNQMFQKRRYQKALELYNGSVRTAPMSGDTAAMAMALANRSAVLLHMKLYELCVNDVRAALKYGYPDNLRFKLHDRRGKCYLQMRQKDEAKTAFTEAKTSLKSSGLPQERMNNLINEYDKQMWQCDKLPSSGSSASTSAHTVAFHEPIPSLKDKINPTVPSMSDALNIFVSENAGRGLITTRDVSAGEVLVVEKPYASTLLPMFSRSHCHHCCNRVLAPVVCVQCSEAVFCSEQCQTASWDNCHKYECDILGTVRDADISLGHLALKMVLKAGLNYLSEFKDKTPAKMTKDDQLTEGFDENGQYSSSDYRTVYGLVGHSNVRSCEDLLKYSFEALYLLKCLEQTEFFQNTDNEEKKLCVGGHILRHLQMLPCNAHECSELAVKYTNMPESVTMEIGSAIYPVLSLINHSCDPNVVRHSYGDVCVVHAIRNIPKGGEVLDNYGALYALTPCQERRTKLAPQYFFTCNCLACTDDFPLYSDTPSDVPVFKCDECAGPIFLPLEEKYSYASMACSFCKHGHDLSPRLAVLGKSDETYRLAMRSVLTDSNVDLDQHIPTLESHLRLMDRLLCRPWRDFNDSQEALKQCYAMKASHFHVET